MGTDEVFAVVRTTEALARSAIANVVEAHWTERGARLVGTKWTKDAVWKDRGQTRFAVAISPASRRGWVTLVESAEYSLGFDRVLLDRLGKSATTWIVWSCDHSAMYGQKKESCVPSSRSSFASRWRHVTPTRRARHPAA
ncbi:MAG: hypothetical protein HOV80_33065, partial [Polyangiaceae bacterium]|nr:hypothetical protein [Polyangiaceae bacterium]